MKGKGLHMVTFTLLVIGGLNWLLEAFGWGIGSWGISSGVTQVIYILVGLSAIYELATHKGCCKLCGGGAMPS